jgi:hypothetical protein
MTLRCLSENFTHALRREVFGRVLAGLSVFMLVCGSPVAANDNSAPIPLLSEVDAWAMLFQMMERLESDVQNQELTLIDAEDPFASAAVSSLLAETQKAPGSKYVVQKMKWIGFVRLISTLHEAADKNDAPRVTALMKKAEEEFREIQATTNPKVLAAAEELAKRFTCPMHPDVIGAKGERCPKCGMTLDQRSVILPAHLLTGNSAFHQVIATITTDDPLAKGRTAQAVLHLKRSTGHPVTLDQLLETHTQKIHLLIVDTSLSDYHHAHPQSTDVPGDYVFTFTPSKPGPYYAFADLRPLPLGLEEYERMVIPGTGESQPIFNKETMLSGDSQGYHFEFTIVGEIRANEPTDAKLLISRDGKPFSQLEPVMGAFAHLVGFNEDTETILHVHPIEARQLQSADRGGPTLEFKINATKPGFTRFFAQVQINGQQLFVPFGLSVLSRNRGR